MNPKEKTKGRKARRVRAVQTPRKLWSYYGSHKGNAPDIHYIWGEGCASADAHLLHQHMRELLPELEKRGYDLSAFKFTITKT